MADRSRIVARTQKGSVMSLCCIDTSHSLGVATDGTVIICDCLFSLLTFAVYFFFFLFLDSRWLIVVDGG